VSLPHLCRSKVKQTALEIAAAIRPANKFSRVGMSFVERIEAKVRAAIREEVRIHPSKVKTLLPHPTWNLGSQSKMEG